MIKWCKEKKKDNKGFTLVELVIVVAILAILVGILAPQYTKYVEKSRKAADASNLENLVTAFKTAASDGNDQIPAVEYTITINKATNDQSTGTTTLAVTSGTLPENVKIEDIKKIITSYVGENWENTKLKSKKWTTNGQLDGTVVKKISATLTVKNDGSVTVTYDPTTIKDQTNQ